MESRVTSSGTLIIGGNFKFHWDNQLNSDTKLISDIPQSVNLIQHVSGATHEKMATHWTRYSLLLMIK